MNRSGDPVRAVVTGVVAEALRATGSDGLFLYRPGTAEHELVRSWADAAGWEVRTPADPMPESSLLPTDPANKLILLLEGPTPGARLLPLGDLWPEAVEARVGRAGWPKGFEAELGSPDGGFVPETAPIREVVRSLRAALEDGHGLARLAADLAPDLEGRVRRALDRTAPSFRPPLIPKLTTWTPGIDPGL